MNLVQKWNVSREVDSQGVMLLLERVDLFLSGSRAARLERLLLAGRLLGVGYIERQ